MNSEGAGFYCKGALEGSKDICVVTLALGLNLGPELLLWALSTLLEGMELNYCQAFKMF